MPIGLLGFVGILWILAPSPLKAFCPNACEMTQTTKLLPELACLSVESSEDTCTCGVRVLLTNNCEFEITAQGFIFPSCAQINDVAGTQKSNCTGVSPNYQGELWIRIYEAQGLGEHRVEFVLLAEQAQYIVTVSYDIESFAPGCYCGSGSGGWVFVFLVMLLFSVWRLPGQR